jgi:4-amino-4-deoxy-L-arabinose transferase-like glycosyltransferase
MKAINNLKKVDLIWASIMALLLVFLFLLLKDLNYNSVYSDESNGIILGILGEQSQLESWDPVSWRVGFYLPSTLIFHGGYKIVGSYLGARLANFILALITLLGVYKLSKKLSTKRFAALSTLLFAIQISFVTISRHASYDQGSIMFIVWALYFLLPILISKDSDETDFTISTKIVISSILLLSAGLFKYTALTLILPLFVVLLFSQRRVQFIKFLIIPWFAGISLYAITHPNVRNVLNEITEKFSNRVAVLNISIGYLNILVLLSIFIFGYYFVQIIKDYFKSRKISTTVFGDRSVFLGVLFVLIFTVPIFHLYSGIYTSYVKQLIYPILGSTLLFAYFYGDKGNWRKQLNIGFSIVLIISLIINSYYFQTTRKLWPNTTRVEEYMKENIQSNSYVLAEAANIYRVSTYDKTFVNWNNFTDMFFYEYGNKSGLDAMKAAIEDQEFDYIIISGNYYTPESSYAVRDIAGYHGYHRVLEYDSEVSEYSTELFDLKPKSKIYTIEIWERK